MAASARGRLDAGLRLLDAITLEVGRADGDPRPASPATAERNRSPCARTPCAMTAATVAIRPLDLVAGGLVQARSVCGMALGCNGRQLD
jgi:hypothetical protein